MMDVQLSVGRMILLHTQQVNGKVIGKVLRSPRRDGPYPCGERYHPIAENNRSRFLRSPAEEELMAQRGDGIYQRGRARRLLDARSG